MSLKHDPNVGMGSLREQVQWRIQDFPEGGREPSRGGVNTPNFPKNCMKSKEFGCPGGACVPHAPPRSANEVCEQVRSGHIGSHRLFSRVTALSRARLI